MSSMMRSPTSKTQESVTTKSSLPNPVFNGEICVNIPKSSMYNRLQILAWDFRHHYIAHALTKYENTRIFTFKIEKINVICGLLVQAMSDIKRPHWNIQGIQRHASLRNLKRGQCIIYNI